MRNTMAIILVLAEYLKGTVGWTCHPTFPATLTASTSRRGDSSLPSAFSRSRSTTVAASSAKDDDLSKEEQTRASPVLQRLSAAAVSVSPKGFHVFLQSQKGYLPLKVTTDERDSYSATSAEALTIIQLLSGVDMAGAILPPDALARMVVLHVENLPISSQLRESLLDGVEGSLPGSVDSYSEAHPWLQNKVKLPTVTLDQLVLSIGGDGNDSSNLVVELECVVPELREKLRFTPSEAELQHVCYEYDPEASRMFLAVALALRYKAPIVLKDASEGDSVFKTDAWVEEQFPQMTTASNLQKQATRVTKNIERGFEVHKLTGALRIATERGDEKAAEAIRAKLDEFDRLDDLPTAEDSNIDKADDDTDVLQ